MKLTYRGIDYSFSSASVTVRPVETQTIGKYRGSAYVIPNYEVPLTAQMTNLKYRGAHYHPIAQEPIDLIFAPA